MKPLLVLSILLLLSSSTASFASGRETGNGPVDLGLQCVSALMDQDPQICGTIIQLSSDDDRLEAAKAYVREIQPEFGCAGVSPEMIADALQDVCTFH